jgi:hypothetical protein
MENPGYEEYVANGYKTIGCAGHKETAVFLISFMYLVSFVFLKLFIAIILEGYKEI